jgi:hypothetical protein
MQMSPTINAIGMADAASPNNNLQRRMLGVTVTATLTVF